MAQRPTSASPGSAMTARWRTVQSRGRRVSRRSAPSLIDSAAECPSPQSVRRHRPPIRPGVVVIMVALGLVVAVVRAPLASHDPLWLDETVSARAIAAPSIDDSLRRVRARDSNPPGWHLLNRALYTAGDGAISMEGLRGLSIVFGVALAALLVAYALSLSLPAWSAALAGALVALGTNFVAHGAELRPYSLLALIALAFGLSLQRAVSSPTLGRLAFLAAVVAVGALTHYFFLLGVVAGSLWLVLVAPHESRVRVGASVGVGLLVLVPWLPSLLHQYRHNMFAYLGPFNWRSVLYSYPRIIGVLGERGVVPAMGRVAFACLVIAGLAVLVRRREPGSTLVVFMAAVPVVLAAVFWFLGPRIFNERNLLVAGPFAALAVAAALAAMPRIAAVPASVLVLAAVGTSIWRYETDFGRASYDGIAAALVEQGWRPSDVIVQFGPAPLGLVRPLGWYLPGRPELTGARAVLCTPRVFVVSYDADAGPSWLSRHSRDIRSQKRLAAYDHTPRGPRTQPPITVAALRSTERLAIDAERHGGHLYTALPCAP